jgi:hypothetical protein
VSHSDAGTELRPTPSPIFAPIAESQTKVVDLEDRGMLWPVRHDGS